jgi:isopenicillin-N N-acyltransferase like protein
MSTSRKWSTKRFFKRLLKFFGYSLGVFALLMIIFVIYYNQVTKIVPPKVADRSSLDWKRDSIGPQFYKVKNNWLRKSKTGLWEMYLEGSPFERGAAAGNLTQELLYIQEVAFIGKLKEMIPNTRYIKFLKYLTAWFNRSLDKHIPVEYQLEIYGESFFGPEEFSFIGKNYDRMLNYHAAHDMGHALANANMVGCTSFSVKDSASSNGKLLIGRNLDFNMGDAFAENKMILFIHPDSGINHAFVSWPGFLGVVSGMNQQGLTITLNAAPSKMPLASKTPISVLAREILQYASNIDEAITIANRRETFVSELLMIGSANDHTSVIIEKSPEKTVVYRQTGSVLTCSNHYQSTELEAQNTDQYKNTSTLYRKKRIDQLVNTHVPLNPQLVANILRDQKGIDGVNIGMGNEDGINQLAAHHGVIFMPEEHKIWVSCNPHQLGSFVCYNLDSVFARSTEIPNTKAEIYDSIETIQPDSFLVTQAYKNWVLYKQKIAFLTLIIKKKLIYDFTKNDFDAFIQLNPEYYLGYQLAGEYMMIKKEYETGINLLQTALQKDIPLLPERTKIEKKIEWARKKTKK